MCPVASDARQNNSRGLLRSVPVTSFQSVFPESDVSRETCCMAEGDDSGRSDNTAHRGIKQGRAPLARRLIRVYQVYVSGFKMGPTCRFTPTCSGYALGAYSHHGLLWGTWLTIIRLCKCGPWHPGGWDPVPTRASHWFIPPHLR